MKVLGLAKDGDIRIENGTVMFYEGADAIRQLWKVRIQKWQGEWFLDLEDGVPYIQEIFQKQKNLNRVKEIFRQITLDTPGVLAVEHVILDELDFRERHLKVEVSAIIEGPESTIFSYDGALPIGSSLERFFMELPLTITGLSMWFDCQWSAGLNWDGTTLRLENRELPGHAEGVALFSSETRINAKNAAGLDGSQALNVLYTPAIRGDGNFTFFGVCQPTGTIETGPTDYTILTMKGTDGSIYESATIFVRMQNNAWHVGLSTVSEGGAVEEEVQDYDYSGPIIFVVWQENNQVRFMILNDFVMATHAVSNKLYDGNGRIGVALDDTGSNPDDYFEGRFGELLVYNRGLNNTEINLLLEYLSVKWGIELQPYPDLSGKLRRADTGAYEDPQFDVEYISPEQHDDRYGTILRRYFDLTNQSTDTALLDGFESILLTEGSAIDMDSTTNRSTAFQFTGVASVNLVNAQLFNPVGAGNLSLFAGSSFNDTNDNLRFWIDYTRVGI